MVSALCDVCSTVWFARWIASLRSQRLGRVRNDSVEFIKTRHRHCEERSDAAIHGYSAVLCLQYRTAWKVDCFAALAMTGWRSQRQRERSQRHSTVTARPLGRGSPLLTAIQHHPLMELQF